MPTDVIRFNPAKKESIKITSEVMDACYRALRGSGIDVQSEESQEAFVAIQELIQTMTDRHFDVSNELNMTRDIQAHDGKPFFLIGVAVDNRKDENNG